jgi:hypothetical protein
LNISFTSAFACTRSCISGAILLQYGHWKSANSTTVNGAFGSPSTGSVPSSSSGALVAWKSVFTSASAVAALADAGWLDGLLAIAFVPMITTTNTVATIVSAGDLSWKRSEDTVPFTSGVSSFRATSQPPSVTRKVTPYMLMQKRQ